MRKKSNPLTISEVARMTGINSGKLRYEISMGRLQTVEHSLEQRVPAEALDTLVKRVCPDLSGTLSIAEAARFVGLSHACVRQWVSTGKLEQFELGGKMRVSQSALEHFLEQAGYNLAKTARGEGGDRPPCISSAEAARRADCSPTRIRRAVKAGKLKAFLGVRKQQWIEVKSLEDWIASRQPSFSPLVHGWPTAVEAGIAAGISSNMIRAALGRGEMRGVRLKHRRGIGIWVVEPASLKAWMEARAGRLDLTTPLKGEIMTLEQAARQLALGPCVLRQAARARLFPTRKVIGRNKHYLVGLEDARNWAEARRGDLFQARWKVDGIAATTGLGRLVIRRAIKDGELTARIKRRFGTKAGLEVSPRQFARWLRSGCPPYSASVAGMSQGLSPQQVAREIGYRKARVVRAVMMGELSAAVVDKGQNRCGIVIPRYAFDVWRTRQSLSCLTVEEATALSGLDPVSIQQAIQQGELPALDCRISRLDFGR